MKKRVNIVILISALCLALGSCIDEFRAKLSDDTLGVLVVDGNIISDSTVVFFLSRTFSLDETVPPYGYNQINAAVGVVGNDGSRIEATSIGDGQYRAEIGVLNKDVSYHIEIQYEGDTYTSEPQRPLETAPIEAVTFEQPEDYGDIYICLSTKAPETDEPQHYLWTYEEDWEVRTEFYCKWFYDPATGGVTVYEKAPYAQGWVHHEQDKTLVGSTESNAENRLKNKRIYSIPSNSLKVSYYYSTLMKQRALSKGEFEYYECKAKLSEEMGGIFTPQPSELPTNITCSNPDKPVIGYVGVNMNVSRKRIYISTEEVQYKNEVDCRLAESEGKSMEEMYMAGYRIAFFDQVSYAWALPTCTDCRELGGTPNKPSFWPLPERVN